MFARQDVVEQSLSRPRTTQLCPYHVLTPDVLRWGSLRVRMDACMTVDEAVSRVDSALSAALGRLGWTPHGCASHALRTDAY